MLKSPEFKQSRETQIIYDLFREIRLRTPPLITWDELCEATGKTRAQIRGAINTAIRRCRNDDSLVIESDRSIGYRLRPDAEHSVSGQKAHERSRRILTIGKKKMECTDLTRLSADERASHHVHKSVLELALLPSRPRTINNVKQMVIRKHNELDEQEMLQAIRNALSK